MTDQQSTSDINELIQVRRAKLAAWRKEGVAFPSGFHRKNLAQNLCDQYDSASEEVLTSQPVSVVVAGRMMLKRMMGKASFVHLQDVSGRIQLYVRQDGVGEEQYEAFKQWDLGDILGVEGVLFKTKTGELSVKVTHIQLLTKSLQPLPDKFHGLTDHETRYRQRYLDLMVNEETRQTFIIRTKMVDTIRAFLKEQHYLEVETPMMQVLAGGAAAKPFTTHHHALDMPLYLRIAPELYLKRLVVGGFERVFEINRNFRNEGLSTQHNPEFTMLEFYQAYSDYHDLMDLTENLFQVLAKTIFNQSTFTYQDIAFDFSKPFERLTLKASLLKYHPELTPAALEEVSALRKAAERLMIPISTEDGLGKIQVAIFEKKFGDEKKGLTKPPPLYPSFLKPGFFYPCPGQ